MSRSKLQIVTAPQSELLTLPLAKRHLRIEEANTFFDAAITDLLPVARTQIERITGRTLLETAYSLHLDDFRDVELPKPPLIQVSGITYYDEDGNEQTLATSEYEVNTDFDPAIVNFKSTPKVDASRALPIKISYTAGYATVPKELVHYGYMVVHSLHESTSGVQEEKKMHDSTMAKRMINPYIVTSRIDENQ